MNYNTSTKTLSKKSKSENIFFTHNELYYCSFLGSKCPLFEELDKLSKEMDDGNFVELEL